MTATLTPRTPRAPHVHRDPTLDRLLDALQDLMRHAESLPCLCLRSVHSHVIKAFEANGPMLALPLKGTKRALQGDRPIVVEPGEIFLVTRPCTLDVENIPDAASGEYMAIGIVLHETVLEAARQLMPDRPRGGGVEVASVPVGDLAGGLLAWCEALERHQTPQACHAMLGVVMRLHEMGHHGLLDSRPPRLAARIRTMIAGDPAREWTSADIEDAFGMSGATLRRHLAAEGASLRDVIADARLAAALELLYTTRLPVKSVAQRVGYASTSSFVKRFTERYGTEPSRIGSESASQDVTA